MTIGIVGLGLIGGSLVKAIKTLTDHKIYAFDIKNDTVEFAKCMNIIDKILDKNTVKECDYIIISVYPKTCLEWINNNTNNDVNFFFTCDCFTFIAVEKNTCKNTEDNKNCSKDTRFSVHKKVFF